DGSSRCRTTAKPSDVRGARTAHRRTAMTLVIKGRIVPLAADSAAAATPLASFQGRVWIDADGTIAAVTRGDKAGPKGFDAAPVVDVGQSPVVPGLGEHT